MEYTITKLLGQGYFGKVFLGKTPDDKEIAIKIQGKGDTYRDEHRLAQEARIMLKLNHPYIIRGYDFKYIDNKAIITMEYIQGKNLYDILKKLVVLPFDLARFYLAEIAIGLDYLHSNKILYRDLKPDNMIISVTGHVKLTDFGLSKFLLHPNTKGFSVCGTLEYIAPEIIMNVGYGFSADWWSYAVLAYEIVCGVVPISISSKSSLKQKTLNTKIELPSILTAEIKDFLTRILVRNPKFRIGFSDLQKLQWMEKLDWNRLFAGTLDPPLNPYSICKNGKKLFTL